MGQFKAQGFVCYDNIDFNPMAGMIRCTGEISCIGDILVTVDKTLEVLDSSCDPMVQTFLYAYNANVRDHCSFLRHDNAHVHPGHPDVHHRHEFDWQTGEQTRPPEWCGVDGWPTLGDFIAAVRDWYYAHMNELPNPETCALIGLRSGAKEAR